MINLSVVPPNPLFFYSCIFNSLIPIFNYYGINYKHIFFQYATMIVESNETIKVMYKSKSDIHDLLHKMGLSIHKIYNSKNIIEHTICALNEKCPVIIWSDCYYQPNIKDMYQIHHLKHCFLVKGVDEDIFSIIDHSYADSMQYLDQTIGHKDLEICSNAYVENYDGCEQPVFSSFSYNHAILRLSPKQVLQDYFLLIQGEISEIESGLRKFESYIFQSGDNLLNIVNDFINYKSVLSNELEKLNPHFFKFWNSNLEAWLKFRVYLVKMLYANQYCYNSMQGKIAELCDMDLNLYIHILKDIV